MSMQKIAGRKPAKKPTKTAKQTVGRSRPKLSAAVSREIDQAVRKATATLSARITALESALEDARDLAAFKAARAATHGEESFPRTVVDRLLDGENTIKVFREWRGLTQAALAMQAGTQPAYISQLETGVREPGKKLTPRLADALGVDADDLRM